MRDTSRTFRLEHAFAGLTIRRPFDESTGAYEPLEHDLQLDGDGGGLGPLLSLELGEELEPPYPGTPLEHLEAVESTLALALERVRNELAGPQAERAGLPIKFQHQIEGRRAAGSIDHADAWYGFSRHLFLQGRGSGKSLSHAAAVSEEVERRIREGYAVRPRPAHVEGPGIVNGFSIPAEHPEALIKIAELEHGLQELGDALRVAPHPQVAGAAVRLLEAYRDLDLADRWPIEDPPRRPFPASLRSLLRGAGLGLAARVDAHLRPRRNGVDTLAELLEDLRQRYTVDLPDLIPDPLEQILEGVLSVIKVLAGLGDRLKLPIEWIRKVLEALPTQPVPDAPYDEFGLPPGGATLTGDPVYAVPHPHGVEILESTAAADEALEGDADLPPFGADAVGAELDPDDRYNPRAVEQLGKAIREQRPSAVDAYAGQIESEAEAHLVAQRGGAPRAPARLQRLVELTADVLLGAAISGFEGAGAGGSRGGVGAGARAQRLVAHLVGSLQHAGLGLQVLGQVHRNTLETILRATPAPQASPTTSPEGAGGAP